jgi:hypothetical protein
MKADALLVIACLVMIYVAWIVTGGPSRPISKAGPYITPITRSGEQSQGYRVTPPTNPLNPESYPRQVGGETPVITGPVQPGHATTESSGSVDLYAR